MRAMIRTTITAALTSHALRNLRRAVFSTRRRMTGARPTVHYFHQVDDPYSHLAAQLLRPLTSRYDIALKPWLVPPPDDAAAPERDRLEAYALRDAVRLSRRYRLQFPAGATRPSSELQNAVRAGLAAALDSDRFAELAHVLGTALWSGRAECLRDAGLTGPAPDQRHIDTVLQQGQAERRRLGHYLGAMFYFEGEWYWGVDRLHHLAKRLAGLGLDKSANAPSLAPYQHEQLAGESRTCDLRSCDLRTGDLKAGVRPLIEMWFSFRSPYTYIAIPRIVRLARHYGAELRLRCILPMVMRGLPVPNVKRLYIVFDTKREADLVGLPFGRIVDPVGPGAERALAVVFRAMSLGPSEEFAQAALAGSFAQGIDLADDAGLFAITRRVGLRDEDVRAALSDQSWRESAEANRTALFAAGLWGAPTFRVNGGPAHWGQDRIWALEEDVQAALQQQQRSAS
jgi:2-hydroxychromene-2-carboxylate isomerase